MAHEELVGRIRSVAPAPPALETLLDPLPGGPSPIAIYFRETADPILLDPRHPLFASHSRLIELLSELDRPVYAALTDKRAVERLLIPTVGRVLRFDPGVSRSEVTLDTSATRLSVANGRVDEIARLRQSALTGTPLLVTWDAESDEIVHVRVDDFALPGPTSGLLIGRDALLQTTIVPEEEATRLFDLIAPGTCSPLRPTSTCIPFKFPDDGCWMRAHLVCREIEKNAKKPVKTGKIWVYGNLRIRTAYHNHCDRRWHFHCAAFVRAEPDGFMRIFDPSIVDRRTLSSDEWLGASTRAFPSEPDDPPVQIEYTESRVYLMAERGRARPEINGNPPEGEGDRRIYAEMLRERAEQIGVPPYARCGLP